MVKPCLYFITPSKMILTVVIQYFYSWSEVRTCLQNHPVAFIGDSRTRGLYYELVEMVRLNAVTDPGKAVRHFLLGVLKSVMYKPGLSLESVIDVHV